MSIRLLNVLPRGIPHGLVGRNRQSSQFDTVDRPSSRAPAFLRPGLGFASCCLGLSSAISSQQTGCCMALLPNIRLLGRTCFTFKLVFELQKLTSPEISKIDTSAGAVTALFESILLCGDIDQTMLAWYPGPIDLQPPFSLSLGKFQDVRVGWTGTGTSTLRCFSRGLLWTALPASASFSQLQQLTTDWILDRAPDRLNSRSFQPAVPRRTYWCHH